MGGAVAATVRHRGWVWRAGEGAKAGHHRLFVGRAHHFLTSGGSGSEGDFSASAACQTADCGDTGRDLTPFFPFMDPFILKTAHLVAVFALFSSLGATLLAGSGKKLAAILHGVTLLLVLLIGFAMLKTPPMNQSWWMIKLAMWVFLGAAPVLAKRKVLPAPVLFVLTLAAAGFAAWLGLRRPF